MNNAWKYAYKQQREAFYESKDFVWICLFTGFYRASDGGIYQLCGGAGSDGAGNVCAAGGGGLPARGASKADIPGNYAGNLTGGLYRGGCKVRKAADAGYGDGRGEEQSGRERGRDSGNKEGAGAPGCPGGCPSAGTGAAGIYHLL